MQDNSPRLMCWACSCSYKRALAKTKQQDPARHSSVFKKEKSHKSEEERRQEREREATHNAQEGSLHYANVQFDG